MSLVPTPRINKHGNTVIRHMRPETVSPESSVQMPPPMKFGSETASSDPDEVYSELEELVEKTYIDGQFAYATIADADDLKERVYSFEEPLALAFRDYINANPRHGREELMLSVLNHGLDNEQAGYLLFVAQHREDEIDTGWDDIEGGTSMYSLCRSIAQGIEASFDEFDYPDDIITASDEDQSRASSLIKVTDAVWNLRYGAFGIERTDRSKGKFIALADKRLLKLAVDRHEDADAIVSIVNERNVADYETVVTVLDSGTKSLREGAL